MEREWENIFSKFQERKKCEQKKKKLSQQNNDAVHFLLVDTLFFFPFPILQFWLNNVSFSLTLTHFLLDA